MTSKKKLDGEQTRRSLERACKRLRCSESDFTLSVRTAIEKAGGTPCPPGDTDCVHAEMLPYIAAVNAGKQKRLPLTFIKPPERRGGTHQQKHGMSKEPAIAFA